MLNNTAISSKLGKSIVSTTLASQELQKDLVAFEPLNNFKKDKLFFGLSFLNQKKIIQLDREDVSHSLIVGPTRSGKGVLATAKIIEALRDNKSVIVVDPKQDDFLPKAIEEELLKQNRCEDFLIANFPNDYSYSGFEESDTVTEFANKVVAMLDLQDIEDNPGASYYRRNERIMLHKIIFLFFNSSKELDKNFGRNWKSLINFTKYLYKDLEAEILYFKEITKMKPNSELLNRFATRYFNPKKFAELEFTEEDLSSLKGLYQTLSEFYDIDMYTKHSVKDVLLNNKVLYIKSDMLDARALKHLKLLINDIIIQAKKFKGANCEVYCDELSFYPTQTLSSALATIAGFGVNFTLMYQDDSQLTNENLKKAIKSNCQLKVYYKSSDIETLEYIEKLGGLDLVTKVRKTDGMTALNQDQEPLFNITRQRAMPRQFVGILISEALAEPKIIQSWFVATNGKFDWEVYNSIKITVDETILKKGFSIFAIDNDDDGVDIEINEISTEDTAEEDF